MPFTWCHHLSSANNSLKITHPSNNGTTFVLGLVGDLESTILNHSSCILSRHTPTILVSPRSSHFTSAHTAILTRPAKAGYVSWWAGSEFATGGHSQPRFWVESSTECDRNLQFKTDVGFHRCRMSHRAKSCKWNGTAVVLISFEGEGF